MSPKTAARMRIYYAGPRAEVTSDRKSEKVCVAATGRANDEQPHRGTRRERFPNDCRQTPAQLVADHGLSDRLADGDAHEGRRIPGRRITTVNGQTLGRNATALAAQPGKIHLPAQACHLAHQTVRRWRPFFRRRASTLRPGLCAHALQESMHALAAAIVRLKSRFITSLGDRVVPHTSMRQTAPDYIPARGVCARRSSPKGRGNHPNAAVTC